MCRMRKTLQEQTTFSATFKQRMSRERTAEIHLRLLWQTNDPKTQSFTAQSHLSMPTVRNTLIFMIKLR